MPKTKFQDFIYTIIMVVIMVYAMVCYNISINMGGLNNNIFLFALKELPLMATVAFLLEFFIISKLAKKITFKLVSPEDTKPIFITVIMSSIIVCLMCPAMSLIGSLLFNFDNFSNIISHWLQAIILSFPMALCFQVFYAGPFVTFIFKKFLRINKKIK